ncbi:TPA: hypothetical protein ACTYSP_001076 [Citrobacter freundii]
MSWQGVPFKLLEAGNVDQLLLKLSSLPKLTIDTPTDYNQLALTVGATFLGGIIPALIAWRTFHVNAKNVKREQLEQRHFLQAERAKQQIFMMGERASQFASLKEDRELQSIIAQKTINAQVVSANRQNWINELRKCVADYCSGYFLLFNSRSDFLLTSNRFQKFSLIYEAANNHSQLHESMLEVTTSLSKELNNFRSHESKIASLRYTILMMINHKEIESLAVKSCFYELSTLVNSLDLDESGNFINYDGIYAEALKKTEELMEATRIILKNEWRRVKQGE